MYKTVFIAMITIITGCSEPAADFLIVAHRGASQDAPENTIPAFLLAWEQGADAIEGDFFLTADEEIVCIHDSGTGRFSDVDLIVSESTLEELRQLDVGAWKDDKWSGTVIPSLAGVFEIVPRGKKIFVEIKQGVEILPKLYGEIDKSGLNNEQIVIISFNSEVIKAVKRDRPEHKAYWLSGLSYDNYGNVAPGPETVLETLESTGADGFSSHHGLITGEFIGQIIDAGYEYHVWTVNDPERAWELKEYGALSITTDVPGLIREYFQKR
jgi:glycerophosphoryl diester phosphodiesterase